MTYTETDSALTAAQCRAGRSLLGWSQGDLAARAKLGTSTVADFERDKRSPVANNLQAMRAALEGAGIAFPAGGAVFGSWRPRPSQPTKGQADIVPMRWITETDLDRWADTRGGQDTLPELVRRLILAEQGYVPSLRFPSGDSVYMHGWDGQTNAEIESAHVPAGWAGWEIGVDQTVKKKADSVYDDRIKNPHGLVPAETAFLFVTPRRWAQGKTWEVKRKAENRWRDVRALDAVDLVQWIERHPGVALWLAALIGKTPAGIRDLKEFWREWSAATRRPISTGLVTADRDDEAARVLRWLYEEPSMLSLQAESTDEAVAFLYAAIDQLPPNYADYYSTRTVVVSDAVMARSLAGVGTSLIIALMDADGGLARTLTDRGHHVLLPFGSGIGLPRDALTLKRPTRYTIEHELKSAGFDENEARRYARDSGRSLTIIRRLVPAAPSVVPPNWSTGETAALFLPMLLAGGWDNSFGGDKEALARLTGQPHDAYVKELTPLLAAADSPIRKVGTTWRIASPRDAWFRLAPLLTDGHLELFAAVAIDVLGTFDPRFEMPESERWMAATQGKSPKYSDFLQDGLAETLILLSVFGEPASAVSYPAERAEKVIRTLLDGASAERWWSVSSRLRELAEASPTAFLNAVHKSLDQAKPSVMALFSKDTGLFSSSNHVDLLWALETLAWSPDLIASVSEVLARLTRHAELGNSGNSPERSLRQIFLLWHPQTLATSDERLKVINRLRKVETDAAWDLMLALYPSGHGGVTLNSPHPRWRDFSDREIEKPTRTIMLRAAAQIGEWLLQDVGSDLSRWKELTKRFPDLAPETREVFLQQLNALAKANKDDDLRAELQRSLRQLIHHHRGFPETNWAMPEEQVAELETTYHALTPSDPIKTIAWMFESYSIATLRPAPHHDYKAEERAAHQLRRDAVEKVIAENGGPGVLTLATAVKAPALVGKAVSEIGPPDISDALMIKGLNSDQESLRNFAFGVVIASNERLGNEWGAALIERARAEGWHTNAMVNLLLSLPRSELVLRASLTFGPEVEFRYWREAGMHWLAADHSNIGWVAEKLIAVKRARDAIHLGGAHLQHVPNATLVRALRGALNEQEALDLQDGNSATMFQHYVQEIFQKLDKADDVSEEDVALLEWCYLTVLDNTSRPPRLLHKRLALSPHFFVELLSLVYRSNKEEKEEKEDLLSEVDDDKRANVANQAYRLLNSWRGMPGLIDGVLNAETLKAWIKEARSLCEANGHQEIGDQKIGETFAWAPADPDGTWPPLAVRDVIEAERSDDLQTGVYIGVKNARGMTVRNPMDGGALERGEAAKYRAFGKAIRLEFPRTFAVLEKIARSYDHDAKAHDDDVDRRQL